MTTEDEQCGCGLVKAPEAQWCCGSCQLASLVGYEVPDTDTLGHTKACELRQLAYHPV